MKKEISVLIIAHNEEKIINECLSSLKFADEIVVILDNCNDNTEEISKLYTNKIFSGSWEIEGERRNFGISKCTKEWILEIDADESITANLSNEILQCINSSNDYNYFNIKIDNFIGDKLVKYGWGSTFGRGGVNCLFQNGFKIWGHQRVHPEITLKGKEGPSLKNTIKHDKK